MNPADVIELRISWRFAQQPVPPRWELGEALVADVEQLEERGRAVTSEVLCTGKTLWPLQHRDRVIDDAMRWLQLGDVAFGGDVDGPGWAGSSRRLYQSGNADLDVVQRWGVVIGSLVAAAIGDERLTVLCDAAGQRLSHVRFVFQPGDERIARTPVETMYWPLSAARPLVDSSLSVLRTAPAVSASDGGWGGTFETKSSNRFITALWRAAGSDDATRDAPAKIHTSANDAFRRVLLAPEVTEPTAAAAAFADADLAIVTGHGDPERGLHSQSAPISPGVLVRLLGGTQRRPTCTVLASCGSAEWPSELAAIRTRSLASQLAGDGSPLTVGFQGEKVKTAVAYEFVREVTKHWVERFARTTPDASLSLIDWEQAFSAGRHAGASAAAVVYVHPNALLGRREPATRRRWGGAGKLDTSVIVAPYYVPGQVAWFFDPDDETRLLRIPLPVDLGVRLEVKLGGKADDGRLLGDAREPLLERWPEVRQRGLTLERQESSLGVGTASGYLSWKARSAAVLSATVRGLMALVDDPVPMAVRELVEERVRDGGGSPDARVRVIDHAGGTTDDAWLDVWPPLRVKLARTVDSPFRGGVWDDPRRWCTTLERAKAAFGRDGVPALIDVQAQQLARAQALWTAVLPGAVFFPGEAFVTVSEADGATVPVTSSVAASVPPPDPSAVRFDDDAFR